MTITRTTIDTIPAIKEPRAKDHFVIMDQSDLASYMTETVTASNHQRKACTVRERWTGNLAYADSMDRLQNGHEPTAQKSDEYMTALEDRSFTAKRFQNRAAVSGGVPCVPAMLAGHPLAMRRREKMIDDQAPLSIIVDIASSAGLGTEALEKRGAAITALVRLLSTVRPVTLMIGCSVTPERGGKNVDGYSAWHVFTRIDTTPIDLGRTAHMLAHPSVARGMFYGAIVAERGEAGSDNISLRWPYNDGPKSIREHAHEIFSRVLPNATESLYIGAAHINDTNITDPAKWLDDMLTEYGGQAAQD
jgi:hypothetical protein